MRTLNPVRQGILNVIFPGIAWICIGKRSAAFSSLVTALAWLLVGVWLVLGNPPLPQAACLGVSIFMYILVYFLDGVRITLEHNRALE